MFSIFQLDFPPNHISYLFPPVQLHVLICHFPSANFPLSFAQSTTFLCPICHFHFQHFSTGFLFESYFIFVSPSNCMCPIGHFLLPNFPLPCYTFFLNWLNFTFNFFQTVQRTFTNYFQVLQYPSPVIKLLNKFLVLMWIKFEHFWVVIFSGNSNSTRPAFSQVPQLTRRAGSLTILLYEWCDEHLSCGNEFHWTNN